MKAWAALLKAFLRTFQEIFKTQTKSNLNVQNAALPVEPIVTFTVPATMQGSVTLCANVGSASAVTQVKFIRDNGIQVGISTSTANPYQYTLDTTSLANGTHKIYAHAVDGVGQ